MLQASSYTNDTRLKIFIRHNVATKKQQ